MGVRLLYSYIYPDVIGIALNTAWQIIVQCQKVHRYFRTLMVATPPIFCQQNASFCSTIVKMFYVICSGFPRSLILLLQRLWGLQGEKHVLWHRYSLEWDSSIVLVLWWRCTYLKSENHKGLNRIFLGMGRWWAPIMKVTSKCMLRVKTGALPFNFCLLWDFLECFYIPDSFTACFFSSTAIAFPLHILLNFQCFCYPYKMVRWVLASWY